MAGSELKAGRVLRFFVSSVGKLMHDERETLRDLIWKTGNFPIAMEGFWGSHDKTSLDIVIENLKKADVVIIVLGYNYGSLIGENNRCSDCPIYKTCTGKKNKRQKKCSISYTHFEYLYAMQEKIRRYCIVQREAGDMDGLQSRLASVNMSEAEKKTIKADYVDTIAFQKKLIESASVNWTKFYDANDKNAKISEQFKEIYASIMKDIESNDNDLWGMVDGRKTLETIQSLNREVEGARKELESTRTLFFSTLQRSKTPITAVTGTCIPFKKINDDTLITYLIINSAYSNGDRLMFPGGHAFVDDEGPEDIAISKARVEAGLIVKPIDLYKNFDVLPQQQTDHSAGYKFSKDFCVYRPPHFSYLFTQNKNAKCYNEKNHHFHYDAVYVCEIAEELSEDKCAQKRVEIKLPLATPTFESTRDCIKECISSLRDIDNSLGDYVVKMLFEAYKDYVQFLKEKELEPNHA